MTHPIESSDKDKKLWADLSEAHKVWREKRFAVYKEADDTAALIVNALEDWNGWGFGIALDYITHFYGQGSKYAQRIADAVLKLAVEPNYYAMAMPSIHTLQRVSPKELSAAIKKQMPEIIQDAYDEDYLHTCSCLTRLLLRLDDHPALREMAKGLERIINKPNQTADEIDDREFFSGLLGRN